MIQRNGVAQDLMRAASRVLSSGYRKPAVSLAEKLLKKMEELF